MKQQSLEFKLTIKSLGTILITGLTAGGLGYVATASPISVPPLVPRSTSPVMVLMVVAVIAGTINAVIVFVRHYPTATDRTLALALLPLSALYLLCALVFWANVSLDSEGTRYTLVVTDSFKVERERGREHCVALTVPEQYGSNRLWNLIGPVTYTDYQVGDKIQLTRHDGFLGIPWGKYDDDKFANFARPLDLEWERRTGQANRASGRFSANSPYFTKLKNWDIPIEIESLSGE